MIFSTSENSQNIFTIKYVQESLQSFAINNETLKIAGPKYFRKCLKWIGFSRIQIHSWVPSVQFNAQEKVLSAKIRTCNPCASVAWKSINLILPSVGAQISSNRFTKNRFQWCHRWWQWMKKVALVTRCIPLARENNNRSHQWGKCVVACTPIKAKMFIRNSNASCILMTQIRRKITKSSAQ